MVPGPLSDRLHFWFRSGELLDLRVGQIELAHRTICLDPGDTKNDEGRIIKMTQEVFDLLSQCVARKGKDDYVFTRGGEGVKDFRGAWWALCEKAGLGKFVEGDDDKLRWEGRNSGGCSDEDQQTQKQISFQQIQHCE